VSRTDLFPPAALLRATCPFPRIAPKPPNHSSTKIAHDTASMLLPSLAVLAAATSFFSLAASHNIQMKAHQRECFHEALHKDDKMTVTFQVGDREFGGSGNLEVDFWVRSGRCCR
jgi:hypothetical protein